MIDSVLFEDSDSNDGYTSIDNNYQITLSIVNFAITSGIVSLRDYKVCIELALFHQQTTNILKSVQKLKSNRRI